MKKILLIIFIFSMTIPIQAKANEQDDFNDLMQYDGYAKATYENTVKLKAYLNGKYTNTKEYVLQNFSELGGVLSPAVQNKINDLKQYIDSNEPLISADIPFKDKVLATLIGTGAELYTWGAMAVDIVKDIFNLKKDEIEQNAPMNYTSVSEALILTVSNNSAYLTQNVGYRLNVAISGFIPTNVIRFSPYESNGVYYLGVYNGDTVARRLDIGLTTYQDVRDYVNSMTYETAYSNLLRLASTVVTLTRVSDGLTVAPTKDLPPEHNTYYNTVNNNNYDVADNTIKNLTSIKMYCSNEILDLNYTNGEFKYLDTVISVDKDTMIANYNGENCTVGFVSNEIKYIADKVVVVTPDEIIDVETGDITNNDGEVINPNTPTPECDGVMCWLLNIFKTIADIPYQIVKAILGVAANIIELLKDMLVALFIPSGESFKNFISTLNTTISEKLNTPSLANIFTELSSQDTATTFEGIKVNGLMGTGEVTVIDSTSINSVLPTIHSWIKGFFYVLLAFFNVNHLYRLIRGTTIFESMRGKTD